MKRLLVLLLLIPTLAFAQSSTKRLGFLDGGAQSCSTDQFAIYEEDDVLKQCVDGVEGTLSSSTGDITDVWSTSSGNVNAMTCAAGDSLDAGSCDSTASFKKGTTAPASCVVGDTFFDTDASAGQNFFGCTATNTWTVQGGSGSVTASSTDTFTNKTIDTEGTGNVITTVSKIWLPFASCQNATAALLWDSPTTNAAAAACITGTNIQKGVADFDASTDESLQMTLRLPGDFTGSIDSDLVWLAAATSGSTGWCVQLVCTADAETDDPAFPAQGSGNCVSDAAKGTTLQTNVATDTGITATGCAAGELLHVGVSRDANGGAVTDDMTGDARAIGLELTIRRAQ